VNDGLRPTVLPDADVLVGIARVLLLTAAHEAVATRRRFHLALSGGSTPRALYADLARDPPDVSRWHAWFGDERCVPPDHPASNHAMALSTGFLARFPPANVHRMRGEAPDREAEAERYAAELCAELGTPPRLDLVLLGLGTDGHTASLFPGTPALEAPAWVTPGRAPVEPVERLTLTLATLAEARSIVFLVAGADKADVLARVLAMGTAPPPSTALPAARVRPRAGHLSWLVDRAAYPKGPGSLS
jgi:6-phosphogluconolactonase